MIIGEPILLGGKGETASIFVTGLQSTDTVTASKDGKTWQGVWGTYTKILPNQPLIPTMTSDTTPSGVASCSYAYGTDYAYKAFDNDSDTYAYGSTSATYPWYVAYKFQDTVSFQKISVSLKGYTASNITFNYKLQASTDGNIWTDLTELQSKVMSSSQFYNFDYEFNQISAKYVRFYLESTTGVATCCLHSMQIYDDKETTVQGHLISNLNSYGTYTVTATNQEQTKTATESVLVDMAEEYEIEMSYLKKLYWLGDECESVTGGWSVTSATKGYACTNSRIDFTNYNTMYVDYEKQSWDSTESYLDELYATDTFGDTTYDLTKRFGYTSKEDNGIISYDISGITGSKYFEFVGIEGYSGWMRRHSLETNYIKISKDYNTYNYKAHTNVKRIWLE